MRSVPDGLTGAIMALEGISDSCVMLHGPGGCRIRHTVHSSAAYTREAQDRDIDYSEPYFFGYPRVPATYLDEYDYINGAYYKLEEGMGETRRRAPGLVAVLNSPGAGLIGDDIEKAAESAGFQCPTVLIESPLASTPMPVSVGSTLRSVMESLAPVRGDVRQGTVVLLGLSIIDKDWMSAREELTGYLEDMGLDVVCCPGAGSSVAEMAASVDAEYAVMVCPEMCSGLSEYYSDMGVTVIRSESGAPAGLDATEAWVRKVAEVTGRDPSKALGRISACRARIRDRFLGMRYNSVRIRGLTFSIAGTTSVVRPLTEWLYGYLAMAPAAVVCDDGGDAREESALRRFLESAGYGDAYGREPETGCDVVLCDGITACTMALDGDCRIGVPIGYSSMGLDDMIPRPVYGTGGVLYILDEILHGVRGT